jgi:hypothetical protein
MYLGRQHDVVIDEQPFNIRAEVRYGDWATYEACDCAFVPCGTQAPCEPRIQRFNEQAQVCWTYSGGLEAEFGVGLLVRLLAAGQINVTVDVRRESCQTSMSGVDCGVPRLQCFTVFVRVTRHRSEGVATQRRVESMDFYSCWDSGYPARVTSHCGEYPVHADYRGFVAFGCSNSQRPVECGGAQGIFKRHVPCCPTVCNPPTGQPPCCGCWGEN